MGENKKVFKFGNNGKLSSRGKYFLPPNLAGKSIILGVYVIDSDVPLLLSKKAMKKAGMKIDLKDDTVTVLEIEKNWSPNDVDIIVYHYQGIPPKPLKRA